MTRPGPTGLLQAGSAVRGSTLYVAWHDDRNGEADIYFNRSTDGGSTWRAADRRLDTDTAGASRSGSVDLCCKDGRLSVVWRDERDDVDADAIYFNRSLDAGTSWLSEDVRVDRDLLNAGDAAVPTICCPGSYLVVVWVDDRHGEDDIFSNHSTDGGLIWQVDDQRLDTDPKGAARSRAPRLCCFDTKVGVVWRDHRRVSGAIHFTVSHDAGATWLAEDKRINEPLADSPASRPRICCEGKRMYVVWSETRSLGPESIYFNRSLNAGTTWLTSDLRLDTDALSTGYSSTPSLCCDGGRLHVSWHDQRDGGTDIYYNGTVPE